MQRAFEGNGLVVTEDGGRVVVPHEAFRLFATGNTVGQGDEYGMYQGARPQSMAMLDRFTMWIKVEYMDAADRAKLITAKFPALEERVVESINKYVTEHIEAFTTSKVLQPITPRGFLSLAQNYSSAEPLYARRENAMEFAFATTVLDRCTVQDRAVLNDIYQRVFG
jgi:cobaltochelatase CobS